MKFFSKTNLYFLLLLCSALICGCSFAQEKGHYNSAELRRENERTVSLTLYLNLPQLLHQVLAPKLSIGDFLKNYSELSDIQLDKEISKASSILTARTYFILPSGSKVNFKKWQFPSSQAVRESFKLSILLILLPAVVQGQNHLDPVKVASEAQTKSSLNTIQLQLPSEFHPILVKVQNDTFWMTEQIPTALVNF